MNYITYPDNLKLILDKHNNIFIPKKVTNKQKQFKVRHKYFYQEFSSDSYFKVIESYDINEENYVTLSFSNTIFWSVPNEIIENEVYELIYDKSNILSQNIINSEKSYYGYEIIYWFYNKYNSKYSEFIPYIEDNGKSRVNESYKYFLYAKYRNGKYTNIQIKLDRRVKDGNKQ